MEINCGSVSLTTPKRSLVTCADGEVAIASFLVSALVKAQIVMLIQEYMGLLINPPKLRGDHHTSCSSELVDADDGGDGDEEEGEGDEDGGEDEKIPTDAKNGPSGGVEENGDDEDNEQGDPNEDDDDDEDGEDDDDDDDDDDDENDDGEDDDEDDEDEDEEGEEEEEAEEEETLQPPKKRKK